MCGMLLARVTTIVPLCLPGNRTFYTHFQHTSIRQLLCVIDRGREASTGWIRGLLSGHSCEEVEGGTRR